MYRPEKFLISRNLKSVGALSPHQFHRDRERMRELKQRYLPKLSGELSITDLDKICTYYSLEHEVGFDSAMFTDYIKDQVNKVPRSDLASTLFNEWAKTPAGIFAEFCTNVSVAFGDILTRDFSLEWALATDDYKTDIAVVNESHTFAAFIFHFVEPEKIGVVSGVWEAAYTRIVGELNGGTIQPLPERTLESLEAEIVEIMDRVIQTEQEAQVLGSRLRALLEVSSADELQRVMRELSEHADWVHESCASIESTHKLLINRLTALVAEVERWREFKPREATELQNRLNKRFQRK